MFRSVDRGPELEPSHSPGDTRGLTRRQFLKLSVLGAGALAAGGFIAERAAAEALIDGGKSVSRTTGTLRRAVPSNCASCLARCSVLGFVEDGKLVKLEGNPRDPNTGGRLCARGQAGINRLYDPDRVPFPLERAGARGEGRWTRLSWEQAYDVLEQKLLAVQGQEPGSMVLHTGLEGSGLMAGRFVAAIGSATLLDETRLRYANRRTANMLTMGSPAEVVDVARARYVLNFGGNPYENHPNFVPFVQGLVDARLSGAKLVTFDPRLSLTAGRSDEWFPVAPGTDGLVALAMANVIVGQNLHNRPFLSQWSDLSADQLAQQLSRYTPEAAETASGMAASDIRRIATEFAKTSPAVAMSGGGVEHQENAIDSQRAILLLNALVGSIGTAGGYCAAPAMAFPEPEPVPPKMEKPVEATQVVEEMLQGHRSVGLYMTSLANPAYSWPNSEAFRKALLDESRVSYLVAIDTNLTETSKLADLVLPAATYLESWGLESPAPQGLAPFVSLRQPIVKARGESLSVDDILLTAGTRLDPKGAQYFPFPTLESYLGSVTSKLQDLSKAGGLALLREHGVWYSPESTPRYRAQGDNFGTGSGRLEFGAIPPAPASGQKPEVSVSAYNGRDPGPLTLVTYRPNVHFGDYSANSWWLSEISHDNPLLIHPSAAQARGLRQGQRVKVVSPAGTVEVTIRVTQGINPRVVALASSFGHWELGRVARAERFQSDDPMTSYIWWEKSGNGANSSALMTDTVASNGGLVRTDARVRVEAVG